MNKRITKIVLTGGPAAGKTTLISRILKEFKQEDGWKVITVPETATELISNFGIRPFGNCISMEDFQYFVTSDMLHNEKMALKAAEMVPEDKVLVVFDRALMDNKAYITDEQFTDTLSHFGLTEEEALGRYDAVLHLVTCAKGAEFAYNFGNVARYESVEAAREKDDMTLRAWQSHPRLYIVDNSIDFEDKINRAIAQIYRIVGQSAPEAEKSKYLISMPDCQLLEKKYNALSMEMMQTYLRPIVDNVERRIRQQKNGDEYLYFYTEKRIADDGTRWVTERPIPPKEYVSYLMEGDTSLHSVIKTKYRFTCQGRRMEIDVYPFSKEKAVLFIYGRPLQAEDMPPEIEIIRNVSGDENYKNRRLAATQAL